MKPLKTEVVSRIGNCRLIYKEPKGMRIQSRHGLRWRNWSGQKKWFTNYEHAKKAFQEFAEGHIGSRALGLCQAPNGLLRAAHSNE